MSWIISQCLLIQSWLYVMMSDGFLVCRIAVRGLFNVRTCLRSTVDLSESTHKGTNYNPHSVALWMRFISFYKMCNFECLIFLEATYHDTFLNGEKKNRSPRNENKLQEFLIFILTGIIMFRYIFSCLQALLPKFYMHFSSHSWVPYATPVIFTFIWSLW
jgi:hypothetical protein